ncbi:hypothetical protein [Streptomyces griseorubiginosus]|uniref:hypothetical protein n=1 Tax=Streptomyces griseorubiginosus TaxID=67304 RepID=UPI0033337F94
MTPLPRPAETVATDAGMLALWDPESFTDVVDHDTWDLRLGADEDVRRHVRAGSLVPINIRSDGAFAVLVRIGGPDRPAELTERERAHGLVSSDTYLFCSSGRMWLSGIEAVGAEAWPEIVRFELPVGRYSVVIHLIAWEDEVGGVDCDGAPSATALPDFVVLVAPAGPGQDVFRTDVETFDPPGG